MWEDSDEVPMMLDAVLLGFSWGSGGEAPGRCILIWEIQYPTDFGAKMCGNPD